MTLRGFLVLLLEIILIILAFGTEFKNFLIIALCIGGLLIYSFISLILASFTLGIKASIDNMTSLRTETVRYNLSVIGVALLPVACYFFVKTTDDKLMRGRKNRHSFMLLPSFEVKRKFTFEIPCTHVGDWDIGVRKVRIEDLFGFFTAPIIWCRKKQIYKKISVLPRILDLDDIEVKDSVGGYGTTNLSNTENGELLGDSRLYREGDTYRRINWKLSARTKKLHSRTYETPQEPTVTIIMDTAVCGEGKNDIIDISTETVISLAQYFTNNNMAVKLMLVRLKDEKNLNFELNEPSAVLKIHSLFTNKIFSIDKEQLTLSCLSGIDYSSLSRVYFVTSNPSEELLLTLSDLSKTGRVACCVEPCPKALNDADSVDFKIKNPSHILLSSPEQIIEKVGDAL